jgi:hypothetical protein
VPVEATTVAQGRRGVVDLDGDEQKVELGGEVAASGDP